MIPIRIAVLLALIATAPGLAACASRSGAGKDSLVAARDPLVDAREQGIEARKDEVIRQLATCESGGYGPSERPIYGGGGAYVGRLQFSLRTVVAYMRIRDGAPLTTQQAAELAHDYDRAAALAKFMIFELAEPWHWPLCSRKIGLVAELKAIQQL